MKPFKPLLANPVDFKHLDYTNLWGSTKLDGIRAIIRDGVVVSRSLKPIPNKHVQSMFGGRSELEGYDGELIVGLPFAEDVYRATNSGVMSVDGEPDVAFFAFDHIARPTADYFVRYQEINSLHRGIVKVPQVPIENEQALISFEEMVLDQGYEGVMLRAHSGPRSFYKYGRSTAREGTLLKLKRFVDAESVIIGFDEEMHNGNEATTNALGRTERSSHAENKVGKGTLGALVCKTEGGVEFRIGTGFDASQRKELWHNRYSTVGHLAKYKHFPIGAKLAPRFPTFLGIRHPEDM